MRRSALFLLFLAVACSTSSNQPETPARPQMILEQVIGPHEAGHFAGPMHMEFALHVANPTDRPLTIRRVDIASAGVGGAYRLRRETFNFKQVIEPGATATVVFKPYALVLGGPDSSSANEPVAVRLIVGFENEAGPFQQISMQRLGQFRR
jgi:hypothetical protein